MLILCLRNSKFTFFFCTSTYSFPLKIVVRCCGMTPHNAKILNYLQFGEISLFVAFTFSLKKKKKTKNVSIKLIQLGVLFVTSTSAI